MKAGQETEKKKKKQWLPVNNSVRGWVWVEFG